MVRCSPQKRSKVTLLDGLTDVFSAEGLAAATTLLWPIPRKGQTHRCATQTGYHKHGAARRGLYDLPPFSGSVSTVTEAAGKTWRNVAPLAGNCDVTG